MSKVGHVEKVFVFGNAKVSLGMGVTKDVNNPFISVAKLEKPAGYISQDINNDESIVENEKIILLFKNQESLNVLKFMIKAVEKEFKKQSKLITDATKKR